MSLEKYDEVNEDGGGREGKKERPEATESKKKKQTKTMTKNQKEAS